MTIRETAIKIGRIHELDLLRGFFILVILIDHFQRWPSPFTYITGEGRLWVSAAEGFFIISGLLIGYLRGWKGRKHSLREISKKLLSRAAMLYLWCVGITFFVVSMMTFFTSGTDSLYELLPKFPNADQVASLPLYIWNVVSGQYASDWIYFLRLYAIILAVSPLVIWLLRKNLWWVVLIVSWSIYLVSLLFTEPEGAMQWQVLFFTASLIGWKLEAIIGWLRAHQREKRLIAGTLITVTLATMVLSYFWVHGWGNVESSRAIISRDSYVTVRGFIDPWFTNNPMAVGRILLSIVWFGGLIFLFHQFRDWIMKWFGWLLMVFGTFSLGAYCLQAILFVFIEAAIPMSQSRIINALSTIVVILVLWGILKTKLAQRVLPH